MAHVGIVICDDDKVMHGEVKELLEQYRKNGNYTYDIYSCFSAKDLLEMSEGYNIILLDIDMPEVDGIQAAKELAKRGIETNIIMLTSKRERFKEAFKIGATRFVTKPIEKEEFFEALDNAFLSLAGYEMIKLKYRGEDCFLQQREIEVIEANRDYLKIYSKGKVFESNKSLKTIWDDLDERIFIVVHRSYIINVLYVLDVYKHYIKMNNGGKVPISRRRNKEVVQKIIDFDKCRN